jgi:hypothetical protein
MVQRRARAADITTEVCNHTFRGTGITTYLENGGTVPPGSPSFTISARTASRWMKW